jgi:DNA invertase Pin-like site-specific DNA recombinase
MKAAIYARVSTKDKQETENQLSQLREYCQKQGFEVYKEFVDHESGSSPDRMQFKALFQEAYQRQFDVVLFWALDRFSREGARETINYLFQLEESGVKYISFTEPYINSLGIFKDAIISLLATLAKQEKIRISERVKAGLDTARKKGKILGRKPLAPIDRQRIIEASEKYPDLSIRKLGEKIKVPYKTVHKTLLLFREGKINKDGLLTP